MTRCRWSDDEEPTVDAILTADVGQGIKRVLNLR